MSLFGESTESGQRDSHLARWSWAGLLFGVWWVAIIGLSFRISPPGDAVPGWLVVGLLLAAITSSWAAGRRSELNGFFQKQLGAAGSVGWILLALTVLLSFPVSESIFGFLALCGLLIVVGLAVIALALFRFGSNRGDSVAAIAILVIASIAFALTFVSIIGTGASIRTRLVESRYESELAMIAASEDPLSFEVQDRMIDPGPPLRVFWVWWYGVLDNVGGIVNDPSQTADKSTAVLTDDRSMRSSCTHLYDEWYYCTFN